MRLQPAGRRRLAARTRSRPQFRPDRVGARADVRSAPEDCAKVRRHRGGRPARQEFGLRLRARRADPHARRRRDRFSNFAIAGRDAGGGRLAVEQFAGAAVRADAAGGRRIHLRRGVAPGRRGADLSGGRVAQGRLRVRQQTGRPRGLVGEFFDERARDHRVGAVRGAVRTVPGRGAVGFGRDGVDLCLGAARQEGRRHRFHHGGRRRQQQAVAVSAVSPPARQGHGGGEASRAGFQVQGEQSGKGWCVCL